MPRWLPLPLCRVLTCAHLWLTVFAGSLAVKSHAAPAESAGLLSNLRAGHPRLLASADAWAGLHQRAAADPRLRFLVEAIENDARALEAQPVVEYRKTGRRLLAVSREVERRVLLLAAAYQLTGDAAFAKRAEREMLAVAAFHDWNPSHFLDVAEMTASLGIGYDWLYAALPPASRGAIRDAIVQKGLQYGASDRGEYRAWQKTDNNWNQVCFGGMILGALAVGDEESNVATRVLTIARRQLHLGLREYAPDGVFPEGPGYWSYGTSYSVVTIAALESALGDDWGLRATPGFMASGAAYVQMNAPSGLTFDFSDCGESGSFEPALFWYARRTGDAGLVVDSLARLRAAMEHERGKATFRGGRFMPLAALWWPDRDDATAPALPLRWHGEGLNPIAVFRSSWTDRDALYLATKAGSASRSHAHMDAGSFVFELDGVRWARDLGMQDYESLESKGIDLWNKAQNSDRWRVFRLNNRSHNTLTIDDQLHWVEGVAQIVRFSAEAQAPGVVINLSPVFAGQATSVQRGFQIINGREVLVQDELAGLRPGADVCWTLVTGATVDVAGPHAVLRSNGKTLSLDAASNAAATRLVVVPANPPKDGFNAPNPGRWLIQVHFAAPADGRMTTRVLLHPGSAAATPPTVAPLADWFGKAQ